MHGWPVQNLAAGSGRGIAGVARCLPPAPRCGRFRVYSAPVTGDRWRPVPGADGTTGVIGGGTAAPEVTIAAGGGRVDAAPPGVRGARARTRRLLPARREHHTGARLPHPPLNGYLDTISITPAGTMLASGGRSDVYVSWDGGQS